MGKISDLKSFFDEQGIILNEDPFEQLFNTWIYPRTNI